MENYSSNNKLLPHLRWSLWTLHWFWYQFSVQHYIIPTFGSSSRGFASKDRKAVTTYLSQFKAHMDAHTVFHRFNSLIQTGLLNHELIENTDREITCASVHAEKKWCKHKPAYWTQELHQLKLHHLVWCQLKSRLLQRLPVTHVVQQAEKLAIPIMMTTTINDAKDAISKLQKSISEIDKASTKRRQ